MATRCGAADAARGRHGDGRGALLRRAEPVSQRQAVQRGGAGPLGDRVDAHWVLDVNFREDDSRTRERTLGNNLSWLRRFAVTLLKRHPIKDSLRGKMIRCMTNTDFLAEVLTIQ